MRKQIINVTPLQAAKVFSLLYFVISIPFVGLFGITFTLTPNHPPMMFLIIFPFMYLIFGFIFTLVGAWAYNMVAGWIGGIEYTSVEISE